MPITHECDSCGTKCTFAPHMAGEKAMNQFALLLLCDVCLGRVVSDAIERELARKRGGAAREVRVARRAGLSKADRERLL